MSRVPHTYPRKNKKQRLINLELLLEKNKDEIERLNNEIQKLKRINRNMLKGMSAFSYDTGFITDVNNLCIYKDGEEYRIDLKELLGSHLDKNSHVFNIDNNDIATFEVTELSNCLTGDMKKYRYKFLIDYKKGVYIVKSKTEIKEE